MKLFDTNVLIYSFDPASSFHAWAKDRLSESILQGEAWVNPVVLAELGVGDRNPQTLATRLHGLGVTLMDLPWEAAEIAAGAYALYLQARGIAENPAAPKIPLPDFLIGAHAQLLSCLIVTVDVDRYRTYFPSVGLITPQG